MQTSAVECLGWGRRALRATVAVEDATAAAAVMRTSVAYLAIKLPWVEQVAMVGGKVWVTVVASRTLGLRGEFELSVEVNGGTVLIRATREPSWLGFECDLVAEETSVRMEARVSVLPVLPTLVLDAKLQRVCADMARALAECLQLPRRMKAHREAMRASMKPRMEATLLRAAPLHQHASLTALLEANVGGGKMQRSFLLRSMADALVARGAGADPADVQAMCCKVEVTQAFMLVEDDVMDRSRTRRGAPTWWKRVGEATAINDGLILMALGDCLMGEVGHAPTRERLRAAYDEVQLATTLGQAQDVAASDAGDASACTHERYEDIVTHKTAYYTFYDPIAAGVILARVADNAEEERLLAESRDMCLRLGWFFQVQDDFLDCYGDPAVTGKVGTDIEDRKHTWLLAEALSCASDEDKKHLVDLYDGAHVEEVKAMYARLKVSESYSKLESQFMTEFRRDLQTCHPALAMVLGEALYALQRRRM